MKYVPNTLTIGRIIITPILLVLIFSGTLLGTSVALGLFILAALSDWLDGTLARRYGVRSRLGQFLDPFADKVLVLGTFVALVMLVPEVVPWWAVVLIALRDVAVTGLRTWIERQGRTMRTIPMAKLKTLFQLFFLIGMLALIAGRHLPGAPGAFALDLLYSGIPFYILMLVVAVTVFTGVWYFTHQEYVPPSQFNEQ